MQHKLNKSTFAGPQLIPVFLLLRVLGLHSVRFSFRSHDSLLLDWTRHLRNFFYPMEMCLFAEKTFYITTNTSTCTQCKHMRSHDKLLTSFSAPSLHCTALHSTAWHLPLSSSIRTVCSSAVGGQSAIHWLLASGFSYLAMTRACSVAATVTREGPHHPAIGWAFNFASLIINRSREEFKKLFPFISF